MISSKLALGILLYTLMHVFVWFGTNSQFMKSAENVNTLMLALILSIPITLCAYYASRYTYDELGESIWAARFIGFGVSYLVFPVLTWVLLGESMLTYKTISCVFLSFLMIYIQVFS